MSVNKNVNVCVATAQRFPVEVDANCTGQKGHRPPQPSSANIIRPPPSDTMTSTIVQGAWQSRQSILDQTSPGGELAGASGDDDGSSIDPRRPTVGTANPARTMPTDDLSRQARGVGTLDQDGPDLLAVDSLGRGSAAVANQPGNVLDWHASIGHQRDESVP
jgi:hypothetical protein